MKKNWLNSKKNWLNSNLMADEQIIHRSTLHWSVIAGSVGLALVTSLAFAWVSEILEGGFWKIFFLVGLVGSAFVAIEVLNFLTSEVAVTNKRILFRWGVLRQTTCEVLLTRVSSIHIIQDIVGQFMKYGSFVIRGSGGLKQRFPYMCDPLEFQKIVLEMLEKSKQEVEVEAPQS